MALVRVQTILLKGPALRWAVAQALNHRIRYYPWARGRSACFSVGNSYGYIWESHAPNGHKSSAYGFNPDTDWALIGPMIKPLRIEIEHNETVDACCRYQCVPGRIYSDADPLLAISRAIVDRFSGDEVLVPAELVADSAMATPAVLVPFTTSMAA